MLELEQYLKKVYEDDISECMMCKRIAIKVSTVHLKDIYLHIWASCP